MKIGIIGLGLIGGSMGLDWRAQGRQVLGVSRRQSTCTKAVEIGAVDEASTSLSLMVAADLVIICTPLGAIAPTLTQLIPHLHPETIVTDVGSVKTPIVETCSQLWPNFLGGHPMAGTAQQGIEAAQPNLFTNTPYVLTPTAKTIPTAVQKVETMAKSLGCQIYSCSPEIHDRAVAWISHLPVMVSASLIDACVQEPETAVLELSQQLASSGFRDTSRVGGGNAELGVMMAKYNRQALLRSLLQYRQSLDQLTDLIEGKDWDNLEKHLHMLQQARNQFIV